LRKKTSLATLLYKTSKDAKKLICSKMDYIRMEIVPLLRKGRENIARLKVYLPIYSCIFSTRSRIAYFVKFVFIFAQVVDFIDKKNLTQVLEIIIPFCKLIACRLASIESER
jgi:hypothetical protein